MTVKRLGAALQTLGIKSGDVITICIPTCIEHVFLLYAAARIGAVFHYTHSNYPEGKCCQVCLGLFVCWLAGLLTSFLAGWSAGALAVWLARWLVVAACILTHFPA